MKDLLFVYGTLRKGHGNHTHFLKNAEFVGEGTIEHKFRMFSNGGFPYLLDSPEHNYIVHGEVYRVTPEELRGTDTLEGYPSWYDRRKETVVLSTGQTVKAWVYFQTKLDTSRLVELRNGDWNKRYAYSE